MKTALNNNLILKPYNKTRGLETKQVATGFSITAQKTGIESLELLVDTVLNIGYNQKRLLKGSKLFFKEAILYTQPWTKEVFTNDDFSDGFIIGNIADVLYIEEKDETEQA